MKNLFILFNFLCLLYSCKKPDTIKAEKKDIVQAVYASGIIEPLHFVKLSSSYEGQIVKIWLKEGEITQQNQTLFDIDADQIQAQYQSALSNYKTAETLNSEESPILLQLNSQITFASKKCTHDSIQYEKLLRLYKTNSVSKLELDNALLNYQNSSSTLESLQKQKKARKLELEQQLANAKNQVQIYQSQRSYYSMKVPENMKVYKLLKEEGEYIRRGDVLCNLGHPDSMFIKLTIDEDNIEKISLGQKVLFELNTQKNKTWEAIIHKIYPQFDETTQAYRVDAYLITKPSALLSGTQLQANIIIEEKKDVWVLPRKCVNADKKVVFYENGSQDTIQVKTGIETMEYVEIMDMDLNQKQCIPFFK